MKVQESMGYLVWEEESDLFVFFLIPPESLQPINYKTMLEATIRRHYAALR